MKVKVKISVGIGVRVGIMIMFRVAIRLGLGFGLGLGLENDFTCRNTRTEDIQLSVGLQPSMAIQNAVIHGEVQVG